MYLCTMCAWFPQRSEAAIEAKRGHTSLRTGFADFCELSCGCWELTLGPLQKQVLSNTEQSL